jgi:hypothetical protein
VRVLLDECVPRHLLREPELRDVDAAHVVSEGWAGRRNGELLRAMRAAGFGVLLTVDRNLTFQQNTAASGIAVIVLHAHGNRTRDLAPLLPAVRVALTSIREGEVVHLGA